ncbi:ABC-type xylose transport system permease subunit [Rhizobium leguminosarum]
MNTETTIERAAVTANTSTRHLLLRSVSLRTVVLLAAALVLIFYFQFASEGVFITPNNAALLIRQTAAVAVVAAGVAILIIMGEIDLSIGSVAFLAGLVAAKCQMAGYDVPTSILAALAVGAAIGLVQGLVITRLAVPAFVVTLGGLLLWRGVGLTWTDAAAIGPVTSEFSALTEGRMPAFMAVILVVIVMAYGVLTSFLKHRAAKRRGIAVPAGVLTIPVICAILAVGLLWIAFMGRGVPNAIFWIAGIVVALDFTMTRAQFGRRTFLVGSNHEAALYAGIDVRNTVLTGFVLMGTVCGIAGIMLIARVGTSTADSGINLELTAIAAAVIGGVSLRGGIGSIRGALMGAFLLTTIDNGMSLLGVSSYAQNVVKALILVLAVGLDSYFTRRQLLGK